MCAQCPYYSVLFNALYDLVLYMQSVLTIQCFICKVPLFFSALMLSVLILFSYYAECPYYLVLSVQSALIAWCFICTLGVGGMGAHAPPRAPTASAQPVYSHPRSECSLESAHSQY